MSDLLEKLATLKLDGPTVLTSLTPALEAAFEGVEVVALDAEGVDLSRKGRISLVQLAASSEACFVLDLLEAKPTDPLTRWLRAILESETVVKVVHDCRMDSDALFHLLDIKLANVHDTLCWHRAIWSTSNKSLNDVLLANGLKTNAVRDTNVYKVNNAFWATRPLTDKMIAWASGDVAVLLRLREKQVAGASEHQATAARKKSVDAVSLARDRPYKVVTVRSPGTFIGKRGANIHQLEARSGALTCQHGRREDNKFIVYYPDEQALAMVEEAAAKAPPSYHRHSGYSDY